MTCAEGESFLEEQFIVDAQQSLPDWTGPLHLLFLLSGGTDFCGCIVALKLLADIRDWITDLRMEYAKQRMLRFPEQNITEIAEVSGFVSPSHFTRIFKGKEGISPSGWRKARAGESPIP